MRIFTTMCRNKECKHKELKIFPIRDCEKCGGKCDVYVFR